jgi:Saccharopine dehydrogenase and related proteins
MKKVIIIGASGSLASYVADELQKRRDIRLTLFLRNKSKLHQKNLANSTIIEGDAMNYVSVKNAIAGQDIVYVNLTGNLETMASNIVKAMIITGVKRIIAISSIGIYKTPLKPVLIPYRKLADIIEDSELEYTILRPDWFTDANEVDYMLTRKGEPETGTAISRKSIASFIAAIVDNPDLYKNENLGISKPG